MLKEVNEMAGNSQKKSKNALSARQRNAIALILASPSITAGCERAGITTAAFYVWMQDETFKSEYRRRQEEAFEAAIRGLNNLIEKAVLKLSDCLGSQSEEIARRAAKDVLDYCLKLRENVDVENRLEKVERLVLEKRTYREAQYD